MAGEGLLAWGVVMILIGILLIATIIGAALGIVILLFGIILLIIGIAGVMKPAPQAPAPQVYHHYVQPVYYPQPAQPVTVNVHPAPPPPPPPPPPPQIMRRCRYCQTVYPESAAKCPSCGSAF